MADQHPPAPRPGQGPDPRRATRRGRSGLEPRIVGVDRRLATPPRRPEGPVGRRGIADRHRTRGDLARGRHRTLAHPPAARLQPAQPRAAEATRRTGCAAGCTGPQGAGIRRYEGGGGAGYGGLHARACGAWQYVQREQRTVVPRQHTERVTLDGQDHEVRLGVWVSNQKNRRNKLNGEQLARLAELGMDWV
ncbi:helicase associated domain-containing protein [Streptomyces violascens]|uniref:helicase associated domain-containing protein n=1 Tax=Streptomyces violascens TaxID=67381 RepID=UPI003695304F